MRRLALTLGAFALTGCTVITTSTNTLGPGSTHEGGTIASDETWLGGAHAVSGAITVSGAKLVIQAGSTITMAADSSITVTNGGSIAVNGTSASRVVFTSAHTTPGDWYGIIIDGSANNTSIIQNANILYAGEDQGAALTVRDGGTLTLSYTRIESSADYGLQLKGRTVLSGFQGNAFVHNALGPAAVDADSAEQLKSTGIYTPNALEGVVVEASTLAHSATWQDLGVAYVSDAVTIATATGAATLTLNPNVIVQMLPDSYWDVSTNGGLIANGTATQPVIFSSSKSTPAPGDWYEIDFEKDSLGSVNKLTYTIVEYGGGNPAANPAGANGGSGEVWLSNLAQVAIDHSTIQYSKNYGVNASKTDADNAHGGILTNFAYNDVSNNLGVGVAVSADNVDGLQSSSTYGNNSIGGVLVLAVNVLHNATWHALDTPYYVEGTNSDTATLHIGQDTGPGVVAVTIEAGAEFHFASNVEPQVRPYGQLVVNGTSAAPVIFTAEDQTLGWTEWDIYGTQSDSSFTYAQFSYGGRTGYGQLWVYHDVNVNVSNASFVGRKNASSCDIGLHGNNSTATGADSLDTCTM